MIDHASTGVGTSWSNSIARMPYDGHHARRVEREHIALATGVVADDHATLARARWSVASRYDGEAGRGLTHDEPVHPLRTGAHGGAQSGGAELQPAVEPLGQLVSGSGEQRLQLGTDVRVGFGGQPAFRLGTGAFDHPISVRSSTRGRGPTWEMTSDAAIDPSRPHSFRSRPCV